MPGEHNRFIEPMVRYPDFGRLAQQHGHVAEAAILSEMTTEGIYTTFVDPRLDPVLRYRRELTDGMAAKIAGRALTTQESEAAFMSFHVAYKIGSTLLQCSPEVDVDELWNAHQHMTGNALTRQADLYLAPRLALRGVTNNVLERLHVPTKVQRTTGILAGLTLRYVETTERHAADEALIDMFRADIDVNADEETEHMNLVRESWESVVRPHNQACNTFRGRLNDSDEVGRVMDTWKRQIFPDAEAE